jgi:chromosome segregation ATPase
MEREILDLKNQTAKFNNSTRELNQEKDAWKQKYEDNQKELRSSRVEIDSLTESNASLHKKMAQIKSSTPVHSPVDDGSMLRARNEEQEVLIKELRYKIENMPKTISLDGVAERLISIIKKLSAQPPAL